MLLHLDCHPMNVSAARGRVTVVLDRANARPSDPRADLARTASILRFGPLGAGLPEAVAHAARRTFIAGWWRGDRGAAGPVGGMAPCYAWAGTVMERGLASRSGRTSLG